MFLVSHDLVIMRMSDTSQSPTCQFEKMSYVHHPEEERLQILTVVRSYPTLFDIQKQNSGRKLHVKRVIITEQHPPIRRRLCRLSRNEREIDQGQVSNMLKQIVIQPCTSQWSLL